MAAHHHNSIELTETLKTQIRQRARDLFARDGELEVEAEAPVVLTNSGVDVGCWVWVTNEAAGIVDNDHHCETDRESRYEAAAEDMRTEAEFREDRKASIGEDDGSYVFGWVTFGVDIAGGTLVAVDGAEENIDLWMRAANHESQQKHGCPAHTLLADPDDGANHLREAFVRGATPETAVAELFFEQAQELWANLGNVSVIESDRTGTEFVTPTITFGAGTPVTDIWHWFEHHYCLSVACDLMGQCSQRKATQTA